jgi:hypothetical protein
MTVGGYHENDFTAVFVGSSGSTSDTKDTGRKCDFKTAFLQNRLTGIMMATFRPWDWQCCLCGQEPKMTRVTENVLSRRKQCCGGDKLGVKLLNYVSS